jgi:hypothetical protein
MQSETSVVSALRHTAFQDKKNPGDWRVECADTKVGDVYVAIFCGPLAEERAAEYARFKNGG